MALLFALAACNTNGGPPTTELPPLDPTAPWFPQVTATVQEPEIVKYYRSDEPLRLAFEHFNRGNFGLAERYFQDPVEKAPKDVTAWTGLAACYDRLGRFELADRAYASAIRLVGETTDILNNEGYSYMLRGNFPLARKKLLAAQARDPGNPIIANNLKLLDGSHRFIRRQASAAIPGN